MGPKANAMAAATIRALVGFVDDPAPKIGSLAYREALGSARSQTSISTRRCPRYCNTALVDQLNLADHADPNRAQIGHSEDRRGYHR